MKTTMWNKSARSPFSSFSSLKSVSRMSLLVGRKKRVLHSKLVEKQLTRLTLKKAPIKDYTKKELEYPIKCKYDIHALKVDRSGKLLLLNSPKDVKVLDNYQVYDESDPNFMPPPELAVVKLQQTQRNDFEDIKFQPKIELPPNYRRTKPSNVTKDSSFTKFYTRPIERQIPFDETFNYLPEHYMRTRKMKANATQAEVLAIFEQFPKMPNRLIQQTAQRLKVYQQEKKLEQEKKEKKIMLPYLGKY
ncbi:hypothetical protein SNEBB_001821 [Seison nebaliae]|nr:hypothetical protein SNEBB_001821 [Seison nebaliae]